MFKLRIIDPLRGSFFPRGAHKLLNFLCSKGMSLIACKRQKDIDLPRSFVDCTVEFLLTTLLSVQGLSAPLDIFWQAIVLSVCQRAVSRILPEYSIF